MLLCVHKLRYLKFHAGMLAWVAFVCVYLRMCVSMISKPCTHALHQSMSVSLRAGMAAWMRWPLA